MKIHASRTISGVVFTAILLAATAFGKNHHTLNGTWTLVPTKSDFSGQTVVQTGTVTINDRQRNISISRNFTYDGASETFFYSFSTDGRESATIRDGKDFKSKATWEGDLLKVTTTRDGATTLERYRLAPDGTLTLNVELPERRPMTLVFQHK